jgi:hypothetical protein
MKTRLVKTSFKITVRTGFKEIKKRINRLKIKIKKSTKFEFLNLWITRPLV